MRGRQADSLLLHSNCSSALVCAHSFLTWLCASDLSPGPIKPSISINNLKTSYGKRKTTDIEADVGQGAEKTISGGSNQLKLVLFLALALSALSDFQR